MAFALIASAGLNCAGNPTNVAENATPIDTTGANLFVVGFYSLFGEGTLSDSQMNSWSGLTLITDGGFQSARIYYVYNPSTSASHTFTYTDASSGPVAGVMAWSGATASPFDQENGAFYKPSENFPQPGSVTPTQNDELVVTWLGYDGAAILAGIDSGFTIEVDEPSVAAQNFGGAFAYLVQTTAGAVNPTWDNNGGSGMTNPTTVIATFKSSGGPPPSATWPGYISPFGYR